GPRVLYPLSLHDALPISSVMSRSIGPIASITPNERVYTTHGPRVAASRSCLALAMMSGEVSKSLIYFPFCFVHEVHRESPGAPVRANPFRAGRIPHAGLNSRHSPLSHRHLPFRVSLRECCNQCARSVLALDLAASTQPHSHTPAPHK